MATVTVRALPWYARPRIVHAVRQVRRYPLVALGLLTCLLVIPAIAAPVIARAAFIRAPLSNAKARAELGWRPVHPSVRQALPGVLAALSAASEAA